MSVRTESNPEELKKRLHRIEGQVRGVAKMIEDDRDCREVVQQLTAIRSAVQQVSLLVVRAYAADCLLSTPGGKDPVDNLDGLIDVLSKTT
jgi:CsoR family transcriptional regulator, copper-sensing transcriptional repressor